MAQAILCLNDGVVESGDVSYCGRAAQSEKCACCSSLVRPLISPGNFTPPLCGEPTSNLPPMSSRHNVEAGNSSEHERVSHNKSV